MHVKNLRSATRNPFVKTTIIGLLGLSLAGCNTVNNYNAVSQYEKINKEQLDQGLPPAYPLDKSIVFIGDSGFDFRGHIPIKLIELTDRVFDDFSRTNAFLNDIDNRGNNFNPTYRGSVASQFIAVREADANDDSYQVNTIIMNGGANDLSAICAPNLFNDADGPGRANCVRTMNRVFSSAEQIIREALTGSASVTNVVFLGSPYVGGGSATEGAVDMYNEGMKTACSSVPGCIFVESRKGKDSNTAHLDAYRWNFEEAQAFQASEDEYLPGVFMGPDKRHVSRLGGENLAIILEDILSTNGIL